MENWKETDILERDIILSIHKKPKSITEIAKEVERAKPTVSETIKRLLNQEIVTKIHNYKEDARKTEISVNQKRIKIEKAHTFYLIYYILISISLIFSGIISTIIKNTFFFLGSIIIAFPIFLMMLYQVYVKKDKTTVYKNSKPVKKEKNQEIQKEPENSLGYPN